MEYDDPPDIALILKLPRRHEAAPRFDGQPSSLLRYLNEIYFLGKGSNYSEREIIEAAIFYTPDDDYELWNQIPEASGDDWEAFKSAVIDLYPGADGDRKYSFRDLEDLVENNSQSPINDINQFGVFYRDFVRVSSFLKSKSRLTSYEEARMFLLGLHIDLRKAVRARLCLKNPDHHPDNPWMFKEVAEAAMFVISPSAVSNDTPADSMPKSSLQNEVYTQNEWPEHCESYQQANTHPIPTEDAIVIHLSCERADAEVDVSTDVASLQPHEIYGPACFETGYNSPCEAEPVMSAATESNNEKDTHPVNAPTTALYCLDKLEEVETSDLPPPYQEENDLFLIPAIQIPSAAVASLDVNATHPEMTIVPSVAVQSPSRFSTTYTGSYSCREMSTCTPFESPSKNQEIQEEQVEVDEKDQVREKFAFAFRSHKRHDLKIEHHLTFMRNDEDILRVLGKFMRLSYSAGTFVEGDRSVPLAPHGSPKLHQINVQQQSFRIANEPPNPVYRPDIRRLSLQDQARALSSETVAIVQVTCILRVLIFMACALKFVISSALEICGTEEICAKYSLCQSHGQSSKTCNRIAIPHEASSQLRLRRGCTPFGFDKDNPCIQCEDFPSGQSSKVPGRSGAVAHISSTVLLHSTSKTSSNSGFHASQIESTRRSTFKSPWEVWSLRSGCARKLSRRRFLN